MSNNLDAKTMKCIRCGFCLDACPTFRLTGLETFSPRGRIYLVRSWREGVIPMNEEVVEALDIEKERAVAAVKGLLGRFHYSAFGGAPLLGIDGVCIICHGSSKERAIANALGAAAQDVRVKLNEKIVAELEALPAAGEDE